MISPFMFQAHVRNCVYNKLFRINRPLPCSKSTIKVSKCKYTTGKYLSIVRIKNAKSISCILTHSLPMHPFFTSGNHKFFRCFQGLEKGCIGNEWVKLSMRKVNKEDTRTASYILNKHGYMRAIAVQYFCFWKLSEQPSFQISLDD